jgi:hypothetical protein
MMIEGSLEARGPAREISIELGGRVRSKPVPKASMLFSATGWTFNVRLGRSGREEGEGIILVGEIGYRTSTGERCVHSARAMIVKADARKRLDLVLAPQDAVLTIPLEPFALQRLQDRLKDLVSGHGMAVRIGFSAEEAPERQVLEAVDFAFSSSPPRPAPETRITHVRDR